MSAKESYTQGIIFDLDGTLYSFNESKDFYASNLYDRVRTMAIMFLAKKLNVNDVEAQRIYEDIKTKYNGELSIGVEKELNINRYEWRRSTWSIDPRGVLPEISGDLPSLLASLPFNVLLLTGAPRVWVDIVCSYMGLTDVFGENIISGEPNVRKPNSRVFANAAKKLSLHCTSIIFVGDQESSDILPAKSLNMKTMRIGTSESVADYQVKDIYQAINLLMDINLNEPKKF